MAAPAADTSSPSQVTLPVDGMTCAACQARVQRALRATPGVTEATVNLMMHSATIAYDPRVLSPEALVSTINKSGYQSRLPEPEADEVAEDEAREAAQRDEYRSYLNKALVSLALGLVAMVLSMPLMAGAAHGGHVSTDPLQAWVMRVWDPWLRAAWPGIYAVDTRLIDWLLMGLTVLVLAWADRDF